VCAWADLAPILSVFTIGQIYGIMGRMAALTRRRSTDAPEECWHIYYGDVQVGTIAIRTGIPHDEDPWGWD
jgi:hypothetical protein